MTWTPKAPIIDTWSDYKKAHDWHFSVFATNDRSVIVCDKCRQTREVMSSVDMMRIRYGCAAIPLMYRLRMAWKRKAISVWSVNAQPPWVK